MNVQGKNFFTESWEEVRLSCLLKEMCLFFAASANSILQKETRNTSYIRNAKCSKKITSSGCEEAFHQNCLETVFHGVLERCQNTTKVENHVHSILQMNHP